MRDDLSRLVGLEGFGVKRVLEDGDRLDRFFTRRAQPLLREGGAADASDSPRNHGSFRTETGLTLIRLAAVLRVPSR